MGRPRSFDEAQVLEGALALFRERGYEGTSVPQITETLGICRQSLYKTFGDKRGLYLRALERWGQREVDAKLGLLAAEGSPLENVRTVIRGLAAFATSCPSEGCLTVTAMVENRQDKDALAVVERQVERLEEGLRDALNQAQERGELSPDARPERLARSLVTTLYGIGLLTRLPGSGARIGDAVSVALSLLDASTTR
ncbi:MAG TPA: TetR family transcriptional regulator [Planctomycetes bacterium]|nr:TetR family transcriptional regulator [Planctomycetota bacterium]